MIQVTVSYVVSEKLNITVHTYHEHIEYTEAYFFTAVPGTQVPTLGLEETQPFATLAEKD